VPVTNGSFVTATLFAHTEVKPAALMAETRALRCLPTVVFVTTNVGNVAPEILEQPVGKEFEAAATALGHSSH
jgi:hypothetical protein